MAKSGKKIGQRAKVKEGKPEKKNSGKEKPDYSFTFKHEIGSGKWESKKPHWPGGKSGVTIGPGYDMSGRTKDQVLRDFKKAGIDPKIAEELSEFAGIKPDAKKWKELKDKWVENHGKGIVITPKQERALFDKVLVSQYEKKAKGEVDEICGKGTWGKLSAEQKEMLFDYSYNVIDGLKTFDDFTNAVVNKNWEEAIKEHKRKSLDKRNKDFKKKYLEPKVKEREKGEKKKTKKCGAKCKYFEEYGYCDRLVYNPPCWQHRA